MKKAIISNKRIDTIIGLTFALYLILSLLNISSIGNNFSNFNLCLKFGRYICYAIFLMKVIYDYRDINIFQILLVILGCVISYFSKSNMVIITLIIIMSLKNINLDKVYNYSLYTMLLMFLLIITLSIFKIIPDWVYTRENILRHSLGFIYPTDCFSIYFIIVLLFFRKYEYNNTYFELFLLFLINLLLFILTDGRLSFILVNICILVMMLLKFKRIKCLFSSKIYKSIISNITYFLPVILFVLINTLSLLYGYNLNIVNNVDDLLSNRIHLTHDAYQKYGVNLFGQKIKWNGWGGYGYKDNNFTESEYNFVDCSYARVLLDNGIIFTIIIILMYSFLLNKLFIEKKIVLYCIIILLLIWSFIEPYLFSIERNIFLMEFCYFFNRNKILVKEKHEKISTKKLSL